LIFIHEEKKENYFRGHYLTSGFPPSTNFSFHSVVMGYFEKKRKKKAVTNNEFSAIAKPSKVYKKRKNQIKNVACFLVNVYNSKCTILSSFHSKTRNDLPILLHTTLFPHPTPTTTPYFYTITI
jgi:hypothetical protein